MLFILCLFSEIIQLTAQNCGGEFTEGTGIIRSPPDPAEPEKYRNNANCIWRINAVDSTVEITVAQGTNNTY